MFRTSRNVRRLALASALAFAVTALPLFGLVSAKNFGEWGTPANAETIPGTSPVLNTPSNDGCPHQSPDGLTLFMASNRPGSLGVGNDIWVAHRESPEDPWGDPENLGAPVNSPYNDFCPTPVRGHGLFFVSNRPHPDGSTDDDIYFTRFVNGVWEEPQNLGPLVNSAGNEAGPSFFEDEDGNSILYFSSTRAGGFSPPDPALPDSDSDIYFSVNFGPAQLAPGLNTGANDSRPNVRKDGREIVFDSDRPGFTGTTRNADIWTSSREATDEDWAPPLNLMQVNTPFSETRASLSRDGLTMYFGSNRPGSEIGPNGSPSNDIYVTTREKLTGKQVQ